MRKLLLVCIITLSCLCMACDSSEKDSAGDNTTTVLTDNTTTTEETTTEETTTEEQRTGTPSGEIVQRFVMYNGVVYKHDNAVRRHIDESEVLSKFEGYEKIGTVNIDNLNMPDEELDATRFEEGANLYAKSGHDSEVYVYSVDTLYRMIPYKD